MVPVPDHLTYFGSSDSYPKVVQIDIDNVNGSVGEVQEISLKVWAEIPVDSVYVTLRTDHQDSQMVGLSEVSVALSGGVYKYVWSGTYPIQDTNECVFVLDMYVRQTDGQTHSWTLIVRD